MAFWTWRPIADGGTENPVDALIRLLNQRMGKLASTISALYTAVGSVNTFTDAATTPSVAGSKTWIVSNTVPTSITAFTEGTAGQDITLWSTTANTTLVHSSALSLKGGVNVTMTATETRTFTTIDGVNFRET